MTIQTEQIGLRIKLELVNKLRSYCADEGRSQTWVIDKALNQYLGISPEAKSLVTCKPVAKPSKVPVVFTDDTAFRVIDYLNNKAGTQYRYVNSSRKLIDARLKEFTKQDMFEVIAKKCAEWKGTEMARYLRPSTLFNASKFEEYLNQDLSNKSKQLIQHSSTRTRDQVISNQLTNTDWAD
jgi:uncharacterized phage protein (TIGR02220 family)